MGGAVRRGGPSFRLSEEIGRELAEAGLDGNAPGRRAPMHWCTSPTTRPTSRPQDAKFHYWTARPNQFDPSITTVVPNPNHPDLPVERGRSRHGPALVLGHLCPRGG